jgi:hypothetical protein
LTTTAAEIRDDLDTIAASVIGAPYESLRAEMKAGMWTIIGTAVSHYAASSSGTFAIGDATDVTIASPSTGQFLRYNGSQWVNVGAAVLASDLGGYFDAIGSAAAAYAAAAGDLADHEAAADPHPGYVTTGELSAALASYLTSVAAAAAYQPLDGDLTALAALTGTGGWAKRTAANTWTISTPTAADVGADPTGSAAAVAADLATHEADTTTHGISAFGATLVDDADAATARATLGLVIGTDVVAPTRAMNTTKSLTGGGNLSADRTLELVNDDATPGANKVYGTDGTGTKGWKADPTGGGSGATVTHGTFAAAPASPSNGDIHFVTGTPYYLSRESGAWVARTRSHGVALTLPGQNSMAAASWTAITGASAGVVAITDYEQGLDLEVTTPGGTSTDTFPFDLAMSPAWASWTSLTIAMESSDQYQNFTKAAACLRESTTGKLLWWGRHSNTGVKLMSQRQIGPGAAISNSVNDTSGGEVGLRWFRMTKNGTNIEFYHSIDGVGWDSYGNIATATAFTTNPDRIALLIMSNVASRTFRMRVWHVAQV